MLDMISVQGFCSSELGRRIRSRVRGGSLGGCCIVDLAADRAARTGIEAFIVDRRRNECGGEERRVCNLPWVRRADENMDPKWIRGA